MEVCIILTLKTITEVAHGQLIGGHPNLVIESFHFNSQQISPGGMFVALTGGARDGHLFLQSAKNQGAAAALISDRGFLDEELGLAYILVENTQQAFAKIAKYYRSTLSIPIVGVTGSNGKTTTKDMIAHVLGYKKRVYKTYKNLNNHLGVPLSILQIRPDHEIAVLEMGMNHAGEIDFLAAISKPDVSVITNVTDAHIENLGSKENIAKAKGEILPHTSKQGFAVLNGDNPYVVHLKTLNEGKTYFYSIEKEADIYATDIRSNEKGTTFAVHAGVQSFECTIPMFGNHNVSNVLPAIFIGLQYGLTKDDIQTALLSLSISPMRFERIPGPNRSVFINDAYNASPASMRSSINTFSTILKDHKKIVVLGDMYELGDQSDEYHKELGTFLDSFQDSLEMVVTIGEKSQLISDNTILPHHHFKAKEEAVRFLVRFLAKDYALLFKASRGMKLEEVIDALVSEKEGSS